MTGPQPFGSLADHLRGTDPTSNVLRSIDFITAGGDVSSRAELKEGFEESEKATTAQMQATIGRVDFTRSPGPVAERYLLSSVPVGVIVGPRGSAKTTQTFKKVLFEGQGIRPGPDGLRRYVVSTWREKYVNQWDATIPSWWKLYPADLPGSKWNGSKPHPATHELAFRDEFGPIQVINRFRAFGDSADSDDTLGNEGTDVVLNQIETMPERLFTWLGAVVGRDPPRQLLYPDKPDDFIYGRFYGDMNAPEPMSWLYRDFYEKPKPGYVLFRQPGGLDPDAENIHVVGRGYYHNLVRINAHRKWWVNINVHNRPGFRTDQDTPYATEEGPLWDDDAMMSQETLEPHRELPVIVGIDGGLTPAAVYTQIAPNLQARILAEVPLYRGRMRELADRMLEVEARRFQGCEFVTDCEPSLGAGEDTEEGSDRKKLETFLGRKVGLARTNNPEDRWQAVIDKMLVKAGAPMLLIDPSCVILRRGFNGSYRFAQVNGTTDRGNIKRDFTTHSHDALQAAALRWGTDAARKRRTDIAQARAKRLQDARAAGAYSPFSRFRGAGR